MSALWRLGRLDKPIGGVLLVFPCWWGIAYGSPTLPSFGVLTLFLFGAFIMRSAGCVINDIADRNIDRQVSRTSTRPLASGEITLTQAWVFLIILLVPGAIILFNLPKECWGVGLIAGLIGGLYPLTKRYMRCPQLILGLAFNMGIPIGALAASPTHSFSSSLWLLYGAGILWTISYDTIYALQDIQDDKRLNIGSSAILFGTRVKGIVAIMYLLCHLLSAASIILEFPEDYHESIIILLLSLIYITVKLNKVDIENPEDCRKFFVDNQNVGLWIFLALVALKISIGTKG